MSGQLHSVDARAYGDTKGDRRIGVLVADGHASMRRALKHLLEEDGNMEVVGEADDFASAVTQARTLRPRVLVLDVSIPGASGLESIQEFQAHAPDAELVLITMENNPTFANRALEYGGLGLVLKDAAEVELCEAVRRAARGEEYRSPRVRHG